MTVAAQRLDKWLWFARVVKTRPLAKALVEAGKVRVNRDRVTSAYGELTGVAKVEDSIRRGAVAVPHGLAEPNVSTLLSGREDVDPLSGMPTYSGVPIALSRA